MSTASDPPKDFSSDPNQPPPERLLPRITIFHLLALVTISAVIAWAFRAAGQGDYATLKAIVVIIATSIACFFAYAFMFLVAYLFSILLQPLLAVVAPSVNLRPQRDAVPTKTIESSAAMETPSATGLSSATPAEPE